MYLQLWVSCSSWMDCATGATVIPHSFKWIWSDDRQPYHHLSHVEAFLHSSRAWIFTRIWLRLELCKWIRKKWHQKVLSIIGRKDRYLQRIIYFTLKQEELLTLQNAVFIHLAIRLYAEILPSTGSHNLLSATSEIKQAIITRFYFRAICKQPTSSFFLYFSYTAHLPKKQPLQLFL